MASENRIWTQNLYQEVTEGHINDLQDNFVFFWELDQSILGPAAALEGATIYYGQFSLPNPGATTNTVLDSSRDWRNRMLRITWLEVGAANQLPQGAAYDPDVGTIYRNVMDTNVGFNPGTGVGVAWDPNVNVRIGAASAVGAPVALGDLFFANSGAATWGAFWIEQSPVIS